MKPCVMVAIATVVLISSVSAVSYGIHTDYGSTSTAFDADLGDQVSSRTVISDNVLQNSISGVGDLKETHSVKNSYAHTTTVSVDINNATQYAYSYELKPGVTSITASETLDVDYAQSIYAWAASSVPGSQYVGSGVIINEGGLDGYSNEASVDGDILSSHQKFANAKGKAIYVASWASEKDRKSKVVTDSANSIMTNYSSQSTLKMDCLSSATQSAHVTKGEFDTYANCYRNSNGVMMHRSSDCGTEYDINTSASTNGSDAKQVQIQLTYYVDNNNEKAKSIQKAINVARNGDTIRVAPGSYYENLDINKNLTIRGSGANQTIVYMDKTHANTIPKDASMYDIAIQSIGSGLYAIININGQQITILYPVATYYYNASGMLNEVRRVCVQTTNHGVPVGKSSWGSPLGVLQAYRPEPLGLRSSIL